MRLCTIFLFVLAALAWAEGEETKDKEKADKAPKKTAAEIEIADPGVKIEDASSARREVTRFLKAFKESKKNEFKCAELVTTMLGKWDHALVLKEAKKLVKHSSHIVAVQAVIVCARQTTGKSKIGGFLLKSLKKERRNHVRCALLVGMGALGYDKTAAKKEAYSFFRRDTKETHKAATRYLGLIKDKEAFRLLAEKLDEPRSKAVNSPTNPPASYWRERWHEWNTNKKWTKWAIAQLVEGETFDSTAEAKDWAKTAEARKHGIKW